MAGFSSRAISAPSRTREMREHRASVPIDATAAPVATTEAPRSPA